MFQSPRPYLVAAKNACLCQEVSILGRDGEDEGYFSRQTVSWAGTAGAAAGAIGPLLSVHIGVLGRPVLSGC